MEQQQNVRFIRVRGRIVPLKGDRGGAKGAPKGKGQAKAGTTPRKSLKEGTKTAVAAGAGAIAGGFAAVSVLGVRPRHFGNGTFRKGKIATHAGLGALAGAAVIGGLQHVRNNRQRLREGTSSPSTGGSSGKESRKHYYEDVERANTFGERAREGALRGGVMGSLGGAFVGGIFGGSRGVSIGFAGGAAAGALGGGIHRGITGPKRGTYLKKVPLTRAR